MTNKRPRIYLTGLLCSMFLGPHTARVVEPVDVEDEPAVRQRADGRSAPVQQPFRS